MTVRMFGKTTLVAATVFASVVAISAQGQAGAGAPPAGGGILLGRHGDHPVQVLEVAEEMQPLLELERAGLGVGLGRRRIDLALTIDANRRHLRHRRVERAGLTARGIVRMVHASRLLLCEDVRPCGARGYGAPDGRDGAEESTR